MTTKQAISYTIAPSIVLPITLLGLDVSSTAIGYVVYEGPQASQEAPGATNEALGYPGSITPLNAPQKPAGAVLNHGVILLQHADINERCRLARAGVALVLEAHWGIDAVAIESPVSRFAKAMIPQCFVSGAVRSLLSERGLLVCEVTPSEAKKALTGSGVASKGQMMSEASRRGVSGEHAADALGVALVGYGRMKRL